MATLHCIIPDELKQALRDESHRRTRERGTLYSMSRLVVELLTQGLHEESLEEMLEEGKS